MHKGFASVGIAALFSLFAAMPSSVNYNLKDYDFGNGGGATSSSNYKLNVSTGSQSGGTQSSASFNTKSGVVNAEAANVPPAPTWTNPSTEYGRLKLVINTGSNPSDVKFQVAVSSDNFVTTYYVQTDNSISTGNTLATYQTYAAWGGASGVWVTGLSANTTYQAKVRALQGNFTGSAFGPAATAATVLPTLSFAVTTSLTATPPFSIAFGSLPSGSVVTGGATANIALTTNSLNGGVVYVASNGGLTSSAASATIASTTADLSVAASGYGAIIATTGQTSGGPMAGVSPFNGSGSNVGGLTTSLQRLLTTTGAVTAGTATVNAKAKTASTTPSALDYTDALTFVAAMLY